MLPTIADGSIVIAIKRPAQLNDIVVATVDGLEVIKRVTDSSGTKVFLSGDNTKASRDSRIYGYIDARSIIGIVVWRVRLPSRPGFLLKH